MYFAPAHGPVALVLEPGAPPTASPPSTENSSTAPVHRTRSRRARYTRAKVAAATADDPPGTSPASASDSPERRFARHLAVASGGATENVDARPIVASRNAGDEVRTADDPFRPVALRVTDQMAEVNAAATTAAATLDSFPLTDGTGRRVRLIPSVPGRWVAGGYADHHYVRQPPEPHGVCYEARVEPEENRANGEGARGEKRAEKATE